MTTSIITATQAYIAEQLKQACNLETQAKMYREEAEECEAIAAKIRYNIENLATQTSIKYEDKII